MADTYVQLPADSTGQKLRMESAVVGGSTVLQQVSTLADASGNLVTATGNKLDVNASGTVGVSSLPALPAGSNAIGSVSVSNFPTIGDATAANQTTLNTEVGALTETAPATDTTSSGLNGRLQRIAQRLSSLIGLFPTSLGQKTSANSFAVTVASDQSALPVTGTFWQTTQPVSGSVSVSNFPATQPVSGTFWQATQPVSGTVTANAGSGTMAISSTDMGTTASAAYTDGTGAASGSQISLLKGAYIKLASLVANHPTALGQTAAAGSLPVVVAPNATLLQNSTVTSTTGAQLIVASTPCSAVEVYNLAANTSNVLVGNSSTQLREVIPGGSFSVSIDNVNKVYVKSASGTPTVVWTARNG